MAYYIKYRYTNQASSEIVGAIKEWFRESFPYLKMVEEENLEHTFMILNRNKVIQVSCFLRKLRFGDIYFEYDDPNCFDSLATIVTRSFVPVKK